MSDQVQKPKRSLIVFIAPLAFFALVGVFIVMLTQEGRDTSALPSALIGSPAPAIALPPIPGLIGANGAPVPGFDPAMFEGKITLVNVWASWCVPCRQEHPILTELASDPQVQLIGLNYKDKTENSTAFLAALGNPYDAIGIDNSGRAAIEWGVYGVPETFIVGPDGKIEFKLAGPLTPEIVARDFIPVIERLASGLTN
ncbi:MAG: DsbE family thiol:disulfide interchange protein [Ahrensia sp.]|nr:DsbE family thiol:disulfide interchange protein [Ahrensia sp.]